jgi:hypothetical protein
MSVLAFAEGDAASAADCEVDAVAALNRKILDALGIAWDRPLLPVGTDESMRESRSRLAATISTRYLARAVAVLHQLIQLGRPIILGDVQVTLLTSLWAEACGQAGLSCHFAFLHRNPLSIGLSLRDESKIGLARGMQIWARHTLASLDCLRDAEAGVVVGMEPLLADQPLAVRSLAQFCGVKDADLARVLAESRPALGFAQVHARLDLDRSPVVASVIKNIYSLARDWSTSPVDERSMRLDQLIDAQDDYCRFAGNLTPLRHDKVTKMDAPTTESRKRLLILHYHLFKNAGTSVDAVLRKNFGVRWDDVEFDPPAQADHVRELDVFIARHPNLLTISSHTLLAPPPRLEGIEVLPVIFVRHPLARLRSAYEFERKQPADTVGARLAKETDFGGYLRSRLAVTGDRSCRNFHAFRLSRLVRDSGGSERDRAFLALDQLPFVGLVEAFGKSMAKLKALVLPYIPEFQDFDAWENSTTTPLHGGGAERPSFEAELGAETYQLVVEANQTDMEIYEEVARRYAEG